MGLICSKRQNNIKLIEGKQRDQECNTRNDNRYQKYRIRIVGLKGSGKTTIFNQIRFNIENLLLIRNESMISLEQRKYFACLIVQNIMENIFKIIDAYTKYSWTLNDINDIPCHEAIHCIKNFKSQENTTFLPSFVILAIIELLKNSNIQQIIQDGLKYQLDDGFHYFSRRIKMSPSFGSEIWIPSDIDCYHAHCKTHEECSVNLGYLENAVIDDSPPVLRRNADFFTILLTISISDYDQLTDNNKNVLEENLLHFSEFINGSKIITKHDDVVLFLTKNDLFEKKFVQKKIPLNISGNFPDAPDNCDVSVAIEWIKYKFRSCCTNYRKDLLIINCVDTTNPDVCETIYKSLLGVIDFNPNPMRAYYFGNPYEHPSIINLAENRMLILRWLFSFNFFRISKLPRYLLYKIAKFVVPYSQSELSRLANSIAKLTVKTDPIFDKYFSAVNKESKSEYIRV